MTTSTYQAASLIVPLLLAIVFHEVAHGLAARALGDPTAQEARRLSLNPLRHVDPIGTLVLPGLLALAHAPVFGWAKPVPVDRWRLRDPRFGMMLVGAAGPVSNLALALVAAVGLGLAGRAPGGAPPGSVADFALLNLANFLDINLFIALFNLLPIPPFDGSHIVEALLPRRLAARYLGLRRYGLAIMVVLLVAVPALTGVSPVSRFVVPPFEALRAFYLAIARAVAGV